MSPSGSSVQQYVLSDKQYTKISQLVYDYGGIALGDNKKELVHARLSKILRKRRIASFEDYIRVLADDPSGDEIVMLLDAISTNVTHFFREKPHFDFLVAHQDDFNTSGGLKVWSAGCSSGEEPYTLAITLLEHFPRPMRGRHEILATDLSTKVLQRAINAIYPDKAVANLERSLVKKYFLKGKKSFEGMVRVKKDVTDLVNFRRLNLIEPFNLSSEFDVIFCRNVMIYFDTETRQSITKKYHEALKPGGYLIIGHSESMNSFRHDFTYVQPTIYRKQ